MVCVANRLLMTVKGMNHLYDSQELNDGILMDLNRKKM